MERSSAGGVSGGDAVEGKGGRGKQTPLSVVFIRCVKHGAPEADAHDAEIGQVAKEGIFPAAVRGDAVESV